MDLLSQGLMGATLAQTTAQRNYARLAAAAGFVAGMLADADVFIRSPDDPLFQLEFHRHFTHSLFFIPIGGLIAALLLWPVMRTRMSFARTYLYATAGYAPSGLLDASTSFGTQLLWPLSDARIAWNIISIVDPLFTLILLLALLIALLQGRALPARIGLALALLYLSFGYYQRERAETAALALAAGRDHPVERIEVKPSIGNLLVWRSIYESGERFHVDAVRIGLFTPPRVYEGGALGRFRAERQAQLPAGSVLAGDVARFSRFSDGFLVLHPDRPTVVGDVRYAMLPNSLRPLWGIELDYTRPDRHVSFRTFRELDGQALQIFGAMLKGHPLPDPAATTSP